MGCRDDAWVTCTSHAIRLARASRSSRIIWVVIAPSDGRLAVVAFGCAMVQSTVGFGVSSLVANMIAVVARQRLMHGIVGAIAKDSFVSSW